jgi:hypothetical protein
VSISFTLDARPREDRTRRRCTCRERPERTGPRTHRPTPRRGPRRDDPAARHPARCSLRLLRASHRPRARRSLRTGSVRPLAAIAATAPTACASKQRRSAECCLPCAGHRQRGRSPCRSDRQSGWWSREGPSARHAGGAGLEGRGCGRESGGARIAIAIAVSLPRALGPGCHHGCLRPGIATRAGRTVLMGLSVAPVTGMPVALPCQPKGECRVRRFVGAAIVAALLPVPSAVFAEAGDNDSDRAGAGAP